MKTVFSILLWIYWAVCIITFFFVVCVLYLITLPFDTFHEYPNKVLRALGWLMLKPNPGWEFEITGADLQKVSEPTIVVANHQSFLDLPLSYLLPWTMKWVAKKELFKIPVLGWIIYMTGHLAIDRQSMRSAKKLDKLVQPVQQGIPAMIFPEGTRTQTGNLKPFKNGAFKLAKRYNFNVLPIVLNGGYQSMPPGSWKADYKQKFTVSVLDPVAADNFKTEKELKDKVYSLIETKLDKLQAARHPIKKE
jgi:1-acyl-sn-glycerol-3-phosphate acyltransferase